MAEPATAARTRGGEEQIVSEVQLRLLQLANEQNLLLQRLLEREPTFVRRDDPPLPRERKRLDLPRQYLTDFPPQQQDDHLEQQTKYVFQGMSRILKNHMRGDSLDFAGHMAQIMKELHDLNQDPLLFTDRSEPDALRTSCEGVKYTHVNAAAGETCTGTVWFVPLIDL